MIQLKPNPENHFLCPECGTILPTINAVLIESVHVMADCTCKNCGFTFYQAYPAGHTFLTVLSMGKANGKFYQSDHQHKWLSQSFQKAFRKKEKKAVAIKRIINKKCQNVIILNTLDSLYGHVLLKLYNAFYHIDHQKEFGLVLIIPKIFEWLIPKGCAEIWIVDLKLSELAFAQEGIQKFVSMEFDRFQSIYLSRAYGHPAISDVDVERLTGIAPFDLHVFTLQKPTITFVLREDRIWYRTPLDYWFYRVCRKLKRQRWGNQILSLRQNMLVKEVIKHLRKQLPDVDYNVVGLGTAGTFDGYAADERVNQVDATVERRWCKIYSRSQVVVGVHGSNMLLPTALAAGCVEILPEDRYGNMIQDLTVRYADRRQLFFYRFAEQYARPRSVAKMAEAMILDYQTYHENMCINAYGGHNNLSDQSAKTAMTAVIEK